MGKVNGDIPLSPAGEVGSLPSEVGALSLSQPKHYGGTMVKANGVVCVFWIWIFNTAHLRPTNSSIFAILQPSSPSFSLSAIFPLSGWDRYSCLIIACVKSSGTYMHAINHMHYVKQTSTLTCNRNLRLLNAAAIFFWWLRFSFFGSILEICNSAGGGGQSIPHPFVIGRGLGTHLPQPHEGGKAEFLLHIIQQNVS